MNQQQWLEWRLDGIGGSDAAVVLGISPYKTRHELWEEKVNRTIETRENASMTRGKMLEEPARQEFEKMIGVSVAPKNVVHPEFDWMRASLDGIDIDGQIAVEIKCPNREEHQMAKEGKIPDKYHAQVQHQLSVLGLPKMYFFSFDGHNGEIVEVKKDEDFISNLLVMEHVFWTHHVLEKIPPERCERDVPVLDDLEWQMMARHWKELNEEIKKNEREMEELRQAMITKASNFSTKGCGLFLQKSVCKGSIDYKALHSSNPHLDLEPYRKPSYEKWTVRQI